MELRQQIKTRLIIIKQWQIWEFKDENGKAIGFYGRNFTPKVRRKIKYG